MLSKLWYYIVAGIVVGSVATVLLPTEQLTKLFQKKIGKLLPVSAIAGIASPLCTYSTVPFFIGLLKKGMPAGPVATFLVASSALNPQMIMLTAGALGWRMAVVQIISVAIMAILVGSATSMASAHKVVNLPSDSDLSRHERHGRTTNQSSIWKQLADSALGIAEHVVLYFVIGVIVASAVSVLVSNSGVLNHIASLARWYTVPLASLIGIPLYVCGGAAIPLLRVGSDLGVSQGAILAFLIVGPATRIVQLAGLSTVFKKQAVIAYVLFVIAFAMILGFSIDMLGTNLLKPAPLQTSF
jgi:uncharacterized membrane protein YraQ (UPF0718 family)